MKWTKARPKVPGIYLIKDGKQGETETRIVHEQFKGCLMSGDEWHPVKFWPNSYWYAGPIQEPTH